MRTPDVGRLVAGVSRPLHGGEWEYVLWYQLQAFPVLVRLNAHPPVPRA